MNSLRKLGVAGLLVAVFVGVVGCGSDDSSSNSAKFESCKQVCDKSVNCPLAFPADACKQLCDAYGQTSSACQDAVKALSDCQLKQADVCTDTACDAETNAYNTACASK